MDLRILHTCNSNCIYCLEQSLRKKKKFIDTREIFRQLEDHGEREILSFYGWNPLLHPDLLKIISHAKKLWFQNVALLTNTYSLNAEYLRDLQTAGLNTINFYFHSFDMPSHDRVVNGWILLKTLLENIALIQNSGLHSKAIIHVNQQNIGTLYKDVAYLNKKFWVEKFECIKYHLVSRAGKEFRDILEYSKDQEYTSLTYLHKVIEKLHLDVRFTKF